MKLNSKNLAAIDAGTNSFHLIVVKIKEDGNFEIIDREKEVIRLSQGSTGDIKCIKPEAIERAIRALKRFKVIADSHNASVKAVATSAVREANNKNELIDRALKETGVEVEVISGYEEARLIYLGILKAVPIYNKKTLIFDIGGGSTEFVIGSKGKMIKPVSIKIGSVRLTQKFFPDYKITSKRIKDCRKWVEGEIFHAAEMMKNEGFSTCVGSSGTIMAAGLMIQAMRNLNNSSQTILNNFEFSKTELKKIEKEILSRKTAEKRERIPGLDEKRAEIIPAGIIILSTIFDLFEIDKMTISGYALREGMIIDTLQKEHINESTKPNLIDIRKESVKHLSESCDYDRDHCKYITEFALQIYDDLKKIHHLGNEYREYLEAASILHDIGYHIAHTNHHHHSYYIIRNSELLGFNDNEIRIIANTSRYHRKSHPKKSHLDFSELPEKTQSVVKILSAILRVADSLDRTHKKIVQRAECKVKRGVAELYVGIKKNGNPEIELWSLERRKALFEEVFAVKLKVHVS